MNATPLDIQFIATGIANGKATVVLEDDNNGFYIATSGSGVSYFQPELHRWQTFTEVDGLANPDIRSMLKTKSNAIWFGTANGASCYCPKSRTWNSLFMVDGLPNNSVWSLLEDQQQNIWFGTNGGGIAVLANNADLSSLSSANWTIYNSQNVLIGDNINALHQDRLGNIWVGTTMGVSCFESTGQKWLQYLKNTAINSITSDKDNNVWFAGNQGLVCYNQREEHWQTYTTQSGLGSNTVQTLSYSETGGLWAGTRNGISQFDYPNNQSSTSRVFKTLTQADGLSDNMVWGLFQDSKNTLWIATWGGGVSRYNPVEKTWKIYTTPSEFADTYTMAVLKSGTKHVWIGTWGAISRYNLENGEWLTLSSADNLPNNNVQCLAQLQENEVWVGAYGGLVHYSIDTQAWRYYTEENGLTGNNVTALLANNKDHELYIGTDNGLCCWTEKDKTITPVYAKQFAKKSISAIYSDNKQTLWIATNNGLFQQKLADIWIQYGKEQGLPSTKITAILVDEQDTVWVGTDKGLCRQLKGQQFEAVEAITTQVNSLALAHNSLWIADNNGVLYRLDCLSSELLSINEFGSDPLTSLALDEQDNLWIASQGGGVFWLMLHGKRAGYLQNFTAGAQQFATEFAVASRWIITGRPEAIAATQIHNSETTVAIEVAHRPYLAIAHEEQEPLVWAGSDEAGLVLAFLDSHLKIIKPDHENRISDLPSRHITALSNPENGHIWVGTNCGLARVNQLNRQVDKVYSYPELPTGPVSALATNYAGVTLVAFNKLNKARFQDKTAAARRDKTSLWLVNESCEVLRLNGEGVSEFENSSVMALCSIGQKNFWLGTDKGVFNLALDNNLVSRVDAVPANISVSKMSVSQDAKIAILGFDKASQQPSFFFSSDIKSFPLTEVTLPPSLSKITNIAFDNESDTLYACVGCNIFRLNP